MIEGYEAESLILTNPDTGEAQKHPAPDPQHCLKVNPESSRKRARIKFSSWNITDHRRFKCVHLFIVYIGVYDYMLDVLYFYNISDPGKIMKKLSRYLYTKVRLGDMLIS
jgi:hypothetical protein